MSKNPSESGKSSSFNAPLGLAMGVGIAIGAGVGIAFGASGAKRKKDDSDNS